MKPQLPGPAVLAISSFFFATMATLIGALHGTIGAAQLVCLRFAVGGAVMAGVFIARREKPQLERWPLLIVRAFFGSAGVATYFFAIGELGTGPATMLNFLSPCYAAVFAPLFLKERSSRWVLFGLAIATAGAALVALGAQDSGKPITALGIAAGITSGIMSGAATTSVRGLRKSTDAFTVYLSFCVFGCALATPFAVHSWVPLDARAWLIIIAMGLVSLIGQLLYTWAMGFTETVRAGVTNQLTPVFSFGMALVFLGDQPHTRTVLGAGLCIAGVLLGLKPPTPAARGPV